jgi:DNA-binding NarL/FixJ family response regulator
VTETLNGSRIRILCVDDHRMVVEALAVRIGREPDMEVVALATRGEHAVGLYEQYRPDVTLMDLQMPTMTGLEAIRAIRSTDTSARIVVLTMHHGDEDIYRALEAGAVTYLLKEALSDDLVRVIREVHAGGRPLSSDVSALLEARKTEHSLTPREVQVVRLVAEGMRNAEIAVTLGISEETVKVHVKNILGKLNVKDRAAVIPVALRRGIIHI